MYQSCFGFCFINAQGRVWWDNRKMGSTTDNPIRGAAGDSLERRAGAESLAGDIRDADVSFLGVETGTIDAAGVTGIIGGSVGALGGAIGSIFAFQLYESKEGLGPVRLYKFRIKFMPKAGKGNLGC